MTLFHAILLGIVQGFTEFLPVSSSGHLVLVPALLGWDLPADEAFVFNVLIQMGTLVSVIIIYWGDLLGMGAAMWAGLRRGEQAGAQARLGWLILLATVPAGLAGLALKPLVEAAFDSPRATAAFLFVTAALLVAAERAGARARAAEDLTAADALIIGALQSLAIFPGVSRSGSTLAGGMARRLDRPAAARFSFLMSVPIMVAAGLSSLLDLGQVADWRGFLPQLAAGFAASAVTGVFAIRWLLRFLAQRSLYGFAVYVSLLGLAALVWL
jgi:undecaprenyl-diphosphatase